MRQQLYDIVAHPVINRAIRTLLSPLRTALPDQLLTRIPLTGRLHFDLPGLRPFVFIADKFSGVGGMYWRGIDGYEAGTMGVLLHLLPRCRTVLDVGAHQGIYTLLFAAHPQVISVHAFEPTPATFARLQANAVANALTHVHLNQVAVTDHDGEATLHIPPGMDTPLEASTLAGFRANTSPLTVRSITIDAYAAQYGLTVDLLKVDTEATEPAVLQGAAQVIRRDRPIILCEVLAGRTEAALNLFFEGKAYTFYLVTEQGLAPQPHIEGDRTHRHLNYLFVPSEKTSWLEGLPIPPPR